MRPTRLAYVTLIAGLLLIAIAFVMFSFVERETVWALASLAGAALVIPAAIRIGKARSDRARSNRSQGE